MRVGMRVAGAAVLCLLLAGCATHGAAPGPTGPSSPGSPSPSPEPSPPSSASGSATGSATSAPTGSGSPSPEPGATLIANPSVVIADIGPGANPYHVAHRRPDWMQHPSTRVPGLPADLPALDLTLTGDQDSDLENDSAVWAAYRPGQVYWVPGTNLLLLTEDSYVPHAGGADGYNVQFPHGIATADAVGEACPDCYVLAVQDWGNIDGSAIQSLADDYPWVDFAVSTSYGFQNQEYVDAAVAEGYAHATRALWDQGRLAFGPTGNGAVTPLAELGASVPWSTHFISLPPWVVMVGGSESACNGVPAEASKPAEVVADFTQRLAIDGSANATGLVSGTSFSTPRAAGLFGQALLEVRRSLGVAATPRPGALWTGEPRPGPWLEDGRLTNAELRAAMALAAVHFATASYVPPPDCPLGPPQRFPLDGGPVPVSPTPWVEMGWGHLGDGQAALAAALVLGGTAPPRDAATVAWMGELADARATVYPW